MLLRVIFLLFVTVVVRRGVKVGLWLGVDF
jgi:hypothetical protein